MGVITSNRLFLLATYQACYWEVCPRYSLLTHIPVASGTNRYLRSLASAAGVLAAKWREDKSPGSLIRPIMPLILGEGVLLPGPNSS